MSNETNSLPKLIETERLIVRPYCIDDRGWYCTMGQRNRDHLARFETDNPARQIQSAAEAQVVLQGFVTDWANGQAYFMGAFSKASGEFVAQLYVGPGAGPDPLKVPEYSVGYFGDVAQGGRGYVTEMVGAGLRFCFEHLHAHRVRLECDDQNERSAKVAIRCGFRLEGHIRENKRNGDGTLSGTLHFGLLKREWEEVDNAHR